MAFNDQGRDFTPRKMVQGNWKCADCGAEITELPFEPAQDRPVHCKDCWRKKRSTFDGQGRDFTPRKMVQGNWKCADCGAEITELPFEPAQDRPVHCKDCWRKKRAERF